MRARFVIAGLPKDYWRDVLDDTDYLFNVLETADAAGDWKALRDRRPLDPSRRPSSSSAGVRSRRDAGWCSCPGGAPDLRPESGRIEPAVRQ